MNGKELKKSINSILLPEESKERIISKLEKIAPNEVSQTNSEEYIFNVEPAKKPIINYAMTIISACAVLAVSVIGIYAFNRGGFGPATEITEEINDIDENKLTADEFNNFLSEYNQEHGTQLRFPTEDECIKAGTTKSACFDFFAEFPDKESFLQYVDILAEKGETIISSFHRINLYEDCNNSDSEVIGYHYYPYNASGQTYGILGFDGSDGVRCGDEPDLISAVTDEGTTGYVMKAELDAVDSASTPEEAAKIMEERKKAIENGTYSSPTLNAYDTDGKTIVGTFTIGSRKDMIYNMQNYEIENN